MGKKSLLVKILILIVIYFSFSPVNSQAQKAADFGVKLTAVQEENRKIDESGWNSLSFTKGAPVYITFALTNSQVKNAAYRVMLDSDIIEPNLLENYITLRSLNAGTHILKITAFTPDGQESDPLSITFNVSEKQETPAVTETKTAPTGTVINPVFFYTLVALCFILLAAVIILLLRRPKELNGISEIEIQLKQSQDEYIELFNSHKRLKEDLKEMNEYNEYLKKQKKDLELTIKNLEDVNVNLIEQKERLVESKRQLELLHTQKDELFAMAIHDIKNPVSAIRGYIELLNSYDLNATEQHEIMSNLVLSSESVVKLTQSMCTIIAQEKPEPTLKFASSSIKKLIDETFNQNMSYAKAKSIKLVNKSSTGLPDVAMDDAKIQEVIENLVNNAIKYGPPQTTVEIRTYVRNNTMTVEVQDTGVGIPEEDLKRVFQKGAVLTPKPTGVEQSSGLGLWIVKKIIEEHNGKVWVNSKVGSGSTFGFELPMEIKDRKATLY